MKKILFFLSFAICGIVNAQYSKLFDFNNSSGFTPHGKLASDGTFLYGITYQGGTGGYGTVFKIKPDGTAFDTLVNFRGNNGAFPYGSLFYDGTFLYGMTDQGGINGWGTIFKIRPDGTGYTKLLDFSSSTTGGRPTGDLISDGTYLYGTTCQAGAYGGGNIFRIKPDGSGFFILHSFGDIAYDGSGPTTALLFDGTWLYGMTNQGGSLGSGTIYKVKPDGTGYSKLIEFPTAANEMFPEGALVTDGCFLYGITHYGGSGNGGVVFKIKHDGSEYKVLVHFSGKNGCIPMGSLICDGTFLYGMTADGGTGLCNNGNGTIFKIKTDGTGFAKLFDFTGAATGKAPYGALTSDGYSFYGTTTMGGANNKGVIFRYYVLNISTEILGGSICSNKCNGSAKVNILNGTAPFTYSWNTSPIQNTQIATGLCAGKTYKVTVTDSFGSNSDSVIIKALPGTDPPSLCAVTVDSQSEFNVLAWDKTPYTGGGVDSFVVFREITTDNYMPIGALPFSALSMFTDTVRNRYFPNTGNPDNGTYRYKIMAHDTCGLNSELGPYHNTIYMTNTAGTFSWNHYTIEGHANPVVSYLLLRDDSSTGNWQSVAAVSGTQQTVADPQYSAYRNTASWRIQTQWGINCAPAVEVKEKRSFNINYSLSNIYSSNGVGIFDQEADYKPVIFPNPNDGNFTIENLIGKSTIIITNILGKIIYMGECEEIKLDISLPDNEKGVYLLQILSKEDSYLKVNKIWIR